jgi:SOS response regulatory protein OraA/RecX
VSQKRQEPFDIAVRALARRDLSAARLLEKLEAAGVGEHERGDVLTRLVTAGLVDDDRVAAQRAVTLAERGYGDRVIDARLEQEGFDRHRRERAIAELAPEAERARSSVTTADREAPATAAARLGRRGFSGEAIRTVLAGLDGLPDGELR